jgi:hypothetical protein
MRVAMKIVRIDDQTFHVEVSQTEVITIGNCVNDAADLLSENEFHARVGVERQQALLINKEIAKQFGLSGGPL